MNIGERIMNITLLANQFGISNRLESLERRDAHIEELLTEIQQMVHKKWQMNDAQKVSWI